MHVSSYLLGDILDTEYYRLVASNVIFWVD